MAYDLYSKCVLLARSYGTSINPLSEVLSLLRLTTYVSGGFAVETGIRLEFQRHEGIECYAVISGSCWVSVDGTSDAVLLETGDCIVLPCGLPFCLATDLAGPRVAFSPELANHFHYAGPFHDTLRIAAEHAPDVVVVSAAGVDGSGVDRVSRIHCEDWLVEGRE